MAGAEGCAPGVQRGCGGEAPAPSLCTMEAVGAAEDVFYEEEEVNCYDFEPLPTLLEDEVSEAGAGTEPPPPLHSPVMRQPQG